MKRPWKLPEEGREMSDPVLSRIAVRFGFKYGTFVPDAIEPNGTAWQLVVPFLDRYGAGRMIVRTATTTDFRKDTVEEGMWVIIVAHERGATFTPVFETHSEDELVEEMARLYNEKAGPASLHSFSAVAERL